MEKRKDKAKQTTICSTVGRIKDIIVAVENTVIKKGREGGMEKRKKEGRDKEGRKQEKGERNRS